MVGASSTVKVGKDIQWLVKASGRIIGPYLDKQIGDLLRERILTPLDEVSRPCGRWVYLRDEPVFAKVIEEVRVRNLRGASDDSTTQGNDQTQTVSSTPDMDELTAEITQLPQENVQDAVFQSLDDMKNDRAHANAFAFDADRAAKEQAKKSARWIWVFTIIVVLLACGFVVFQQFIARPIQNRTAFDSSSSDGVKAIEAGEYSHAYDLFNRAYALDPSDSSVYLYLGMLKIQIENQAFQGRQLLQKLRDNTGAEQKHVLTGIGLSYMKDADYQTAETYFRQALNADPVFLPATIDLGADALYEGDWNKANDHLQVAVKDSHHDGVEFIMLAETLAQLYSQNKNNSQLQDGVKALTEFANQNLDYSLEARVAAVYLLSLLNDKTAILAQIDGILDSDLELTEDHRHNLFVDRDRVNWGMLSNWCSKAVQILDAAPHVSAFEAMCMAKAGQFADANRRMDDAVAQSPKDPLVQSINAYILGSTNMMDRAKVALDSAIANNSNDQWVQPYRLMARYCQQQGDLACEKTNWLKVLTKTNRDIAADAELAKLALKVSNLDEAKKYLRAALDLSDHYLPLYALNRAISQADHNAKTPGM